MPISPHFHKNEFYTHTHKRTHTLCPCHILIISEYDKYLLALSKLVSSQMLSIFECHWNNTELVRSWETMHTNTLSKHQRRIFFKIFIQEKMFCDDNSHNIRSVKSTYVVASMCWLGYMFARKYLAVCVAYQLKVHVKRICMYVRGVVFA